MIANLIKKLEKLSLVNVSVLLCLIGFLLYVRMLGNNFALGDDKYQIQVNTLIRSLSNIPALFLGSTIYSPDGQGLNGIYYKPLMSVSFAVVYSMFKLNPFGYHLLDLLLHLGNTILLFVFLKKLFTLVKLSYAQNFAFFAALIFLIHPANVESVAFIASTQELLYMCFFLISMLLTMQFAEKGGKKLLTFIFLATLLSLLSKEAGILAVILSPFFAYLFYRSKTMPLIISNTVALAVYLFMRLGIAHVSFGDRLPEPIMVAPLSQRLTTIPYELYTYIRLIFFPKDLYIWYLWVVKSVSDTRFVLLLPLDALVIGFFVWFLFRLKSKLYVFFFVLSLLGFGIVINIIPVDATIAERWVYGPLVGVLGMLVLITHAWLQKAKAARMWVLFGLVIIIPVFFIRSFIRIGDWKDTLTLFAHDEQYHTNSSIYYYHYGFFLKDAGRASEAQRAFIHYVYNARTYGAQ